MIIKSYGFGNIILNQNVSISNDIILFDNEKHIDWWRETGHSVIIDDISPIISYNPEIVVFGQGNSGMMKITNNVRQLFKSKKIKLISDITDKVIRIINGLFEKKIKFAAGLHLTC